MAAPVETDVVYTYMRSPVGSIIMTRTASGLTHINFQDGPHPIHVLPGWRECEETLKDATNQLHAYFYGNRERFELPLAPAGTPFEQRVWDALKRIPCGDTVSYSDIARAIGQPKATRAVGGAIGRNPLPIVIPCHRVIGADGRLTGYSGGLRIKKALLRLEEKLTRESSERVITPVDTGAQELESALS